MNKQEINREWDAFQDVLIRLKGEETSLLQLRRKYFKILPDNSSRWLEGYDFSKYHLAPVVAKGISAFLSNEDPKTPYGLSLRYLKRHGMTFNYDNIFKTYFDRCFTFVDVEQKKSLPPKRKTHSELILDHLKNEEVFLNESHQLFNEVLEDEMQIIEEIKEAALYYRSWVKETYITKDNQNKPELSISQIALKYFYEGKSITRINGDEIAKQYGWKSGEGLYQQFSYFSSTANRKGKPNPDTSIKMKNKIELFESVYELLPEANKQRALDELNILKGIYKSEYE